MNDLEERIEALESDKAGLEWMIIYLAKKALAREENAVTAALAMQREIQQFGRAFVDYALNAEDAPGSPRRVLNFSSSINFLADRITEEVRETVLANHAAGN